MMFRCSINYILLSIGLDRLLNNGHFHIHPPVTSAQALRPLSKIPDVPWLEKHAAAWTPGGQESRCGPKKQRKEMQKRLNLLVGVLP